MGRTWTGAFLCREASVIMDELSINASGLRTTLRAALYKAAPDQGGGEDRYTDRFLLFFQDSQGHNLFVHMNEENLLLARSYRNPDHWYMLRQDEGGIQRLMAATATEDGAGIRILVHESTDAETTFDFVIRCTYDPVKKRFEASSVDATRNDAQ